MFSRSDRKDEFRFDFPAQIIIAQQLQKPRFLRIIYWELAKFDSSNNSGASGMNSGMLRQRMESA
jgi:hypothetical protein